METGQIAIKLRFKGEIHRVRVQLNNFTLASLRELFNSTYSNLPEGYQIQYKDNEGDIVTVVNDLEFMEACRVFLRLNGDSKTMSFFACSSFNIQDRIAPVIKAVEEFAQTVSTAAAELVQKAKEKEWAEKARQHAEMTGQAIQQGAKDTGVFFEENYRKFNETEFAQKMKDMVDDIRKSTTEFIEQTRQSEIFAPRPSQTEVSEESSVQEDTVVQPAEQPDVQPTEQPVEQPTEQAFEPEPVQQTVVETPEVVDTKVVVEQNSDNESTSSETTTSSQEGEWDMVVPPMPVSGSQDLRQWSDEYKVIREMFPEVSYERCEQLLNRFDGNLQIVLNALMDM